MKKFILITLAGSALNFPVLADDINEMNAKSEQLGLIGVDEAKSIALEAKPGIIDDIDLDNRSFVGGWDYEIEVLGKDGKEWGVYINAETGEVRKVSRDWDLF
ncbi:MULTISPECIES: PepSY domain-containing protein [unclassified Methylophaga]|uniref:PepSY domain-containing protein n=1 Tax=unclassified Methylophaga TaxID=2629249 RepID=UPI000C0EB354|nr:MULTISPECIES: PepSY domain-containing protein [unclassified Methylophaga]MBL1458913.1 PepSY domain-containing protein [Methylophaga sp.]|tara:strand:- start:207 stop:515 length:309 start_codon:yes stop_codon:yes gene_type:complete